jgi:hypothetical protein
VTFEEVRRLYIAYAGEQKLDVENAIKNEIKLVQITGF